MSSSRSRDTSAESLAKLAQARYVADAALDSGSVPSLPAPSERLVILGSLDEIRGAVVAATHAARRLLSIYTPDLEPDLYEHAEVLEACKQFVLARRFARIRVLLAGSRELLREGNRFVAMSRRLSGCIEIRCATADVAQRASAYLLADDRAVVFRMRTDAWEGIADLDNPGVAKLHLTQFDTLWNQSLPELNPWGGLPRSD